MDDRTIPSSFDVAGQVLNLIEFLSAYDAQRNPAVTDIADLGMYRLLSGSLPTDPAVQAKASDDVWLQVDFLDLPTAPTVSTDVRALLVDARITADRAPDVTPLVLPDLPAAADDEFSVEAEAVRAAEEERLTEEWTARTLPARDWIEQV